MYRRHTHPSHSGRDGQLQPTKAATLAVVVPTFRLPSPVSSSYFPKRSTSPPKDRGHFPSSRLFWSFLSSPCCSAVGHYYTQGMIPSLYAMGGPMNGAARCHDGSGLLSRGRWWRQVRRLYFITVGPACAYFFRCFCLLPTVATDGRLREGAGGECRRQTSPSISEPPPKTPPKQRQRVRTKQRDDDDFSPSRRPRWWMKY